MAAPALSACQPDRARVRSFWKDRSMPTKPKPAETDEAREQARRALQTSMDTRQ
jgi:hypothetical protein